MWHLLKHFEESFVGPGQRITEKRNRSDRSGCLCKSGKRNTVRPKIRIFETEIDEQMIGPVILEGGCEWNVDPARLINGQVALNDSRPADPLPCCIIVRVARLTGVLKAD